MLTLALLATWLAPVNGPVDTPFAGGPDPFAPGLRRTLALRAESGERVSAPCTGAVTFSGTTPRGPAVTLRCGSRRATLMGLRPAADAGDRVRRGARVGTATGTVRLSVRTDRAYLDPAAQLGRRAPRGAPPPGIAPPPRGAPLPRAAAPPRTAPARAAPLPWTAWAGAGVLALAGAAGVRVRARRRLEPRAAARAA